MIGPLDLAAIRARVEDVRRNAQYGKASRSRRIVNEASAADIPALLAEVERLRTGIEAALRELHMADHDDDPHDPICRAKGFLRALAGPEVTR